MTWLPIWNWRCNPLDGAGRKRCPAAPDIEGGLFVVGRQFGLVGVHHEDGEKFRRLGLAAVGADAVMIAGEFGKAFAGLVNLHRSVVHLAFDRALQNGGVDEGRFRVGMARRCTAGLIFDEHGLDALAGNVRKLMVVDERYLGLVARGIGCGAGNKGNGECRCRNYFS
ncbi:hypothetical protein RHECNPAF_14110011 [Rhizobium etli CNPAF512]|nr:hypothetical protein RHECNPAF_14110011 [Rhizobium etli CNPAF512]